MIEHPISPIHRHTDSHVDPRLGLHHLHSLVVGEARMRSEVTGKIEQTRAARTAIRAVVLAAAHQKRVLKLVHKCTPELRDLGGIHGEEQLHARDDALERVLNVTSRAGRCTVRCWLVLLALRRLQIGLLGMCLTMYCWRE